MQDGDSRTSSRRSSVQQIEEETRTETKTTEEKKKKVRQSLFQVYLDGYHFFVMLLFILVFNRLHLKEKNRPLKRR